MTEDIRQGVGGVRTTLREPYPDEPRTPEQVRDLAVIYERLRSAKDQIAKITIRAEEDATRISGAIPCVSGGKDSPRDPPESTIGLLNDALDGLNTWLFRLDDATGRFSNL